ncbi:MAG: tetratricopeptide repeat protein [Chryseobacterium sp.]|uniref:tetratricopeptide repeat protein n=1 Tax=Chryseobacterium sp. TaxID=1871047 RepID=UPI001B014954|nr:tetratricopeptide repeat protein [Chryseobacterium sp.]MBO6185984.1 tetratricopeptide repeat protein [Chryseobacterium sp.]
MIKFLLYFLTFSFLFISCNSSRDDDYFDTLNKKINNSIASTKEDRDVIVKRFYKEELQKYNQNKQQLYLVSSKYINVLYYSGKRNEQIPIVYELLKLNKGKYKYVDIACKYNLANHFEISSPDWSMRNINEAIETNEKVGNKYYLPHLYHFKGRLFYNKEDYQNALVFFKKALNTYDKEKDLVYIASMHNNFGMCYDKMGKIDLAIKETNIGIQILTQQKEIDNKQKIFIYYMKGSLGEYYRELKKYDIAEKLFLEKWKFSFKNGNNRMALYAARDILSIYDATDKRTDEDQIIESLKILEPKLEKVKDKIILTKLIKDYYLRKDNYKDFKVISMKMGELNDEQDHLAQKELRKTVDAIDSYIIKEINNEKEDEKKKNVLLFFSLVLIIVIFIGFIIILRMRKKKKESLIEKEKIILETSKEILEKDLQLQKEKVKNLHLNLNLRTETKKAFLENLKKIKKTKNIEPEEIIKDLQFKINNLIQLDKKNNELINESSLENKLFMDKLSARYPILTHQELKLCVYFKLNLSGKEISLLERFTVGSIRVYKAKIKSKIGLSKEENLNEFLSTI